MFYTLGNVQRGLFCHNQSYLTWREYVSSYSFSLQLNFHALVNCFLMILPEDNQTTYQVELYFRWQVFSRSELEALQGLNAAGLAATAIPRVDASGARAMNSRSCEV